MSEIIEPQTLAEFDAIPGASEAFLSAVEWQDGLSRLDWAEVWDRTERYCRALGLPTDLDHPLYRALQRRGRAHRAEVQA